MYSERNNKKNVPAVTKHSAYWDSEWTNGAFDFIQTQGNTYGVGEEKVI